MTPNPKILLPYGLSKCPKCGRYYEPSVIECTVCEVLTETFSPVQEFLSDTGQPLAPPPPPQPRGVQRPHHLIWGDDVQSYMKCDRCLQTFSRSARLLQLLFDCPGPPEAA